ncbi:hypothetical protein F3087_29345 [Nocardia colli]|uniref:Tetratricopeptide repeat protein n=1 Tax=Nocardia colli TaxID=2545717 RepID=A0A5N0EC74_9NOCA|nr:hypothetical protein [Nocardia colli]KAA8885735.1 hypothetical protein F3087_29345 [Nocardia colli]
MSRYRELDNRRREANAPIDLGVVRRLAGDYEQADELHQQTLTLHRELGDRLGEAEALNC